MTSKELTDYIKKQMNSGYPPEQIKDALIKRGWQESQVNEAVSSLQQETTKEIPKKDSNKKLIAAVIIVVICLIGVPFYLIFHLGIFNPANFPISTGFNQFGTPVWGYSGSDLTVRFPNPLSYDITITEATADDCDPITDMEIPSGTAIDLEFSGCEPLSAGTVYTVEVEIRHIKPDQPLEVTELGTVSGNAL